MQMGTSDKLNIKSILENLDQYRPKRKGWTWRTKIQTKKGDFEYKDTSSDLKNSEPLPAATYFNDIDPQPDMILTTEIASGRFEDDIRRMRMAAWHGADHIMVIRTTGQSHIEGLLEGTPEGIGGIPITRKQIRATRKALDIIEEEVGRPINFHSYVSGVAGPEMAVLFNEEGVNGAHQDPQYNILYRNINMVRSFVDAAVSKKIMSDGGILQIDGAHNANATAIEAHKVRPELLVQHAINCRFSELIGMKKNMIALSTVPTSTAPSPNYIIDLPYAIALRDLFQGFRIRAQMNTKYMTSCEREATVTHVLNLLISKLTSADIQSTITPDEGKNVPWHYNNIQALNTAKQTLISLDSLNDLVSVRQDGILPKIVRELKERAVLFLEEILEMGGYFNSVENGMFVDSGFFPERNADGIKRQKDGGIGNNSIFKRENDYYAPVCSHFGYNKINSYKKPCDPINGCTLCNPNKIVYIDELDDQDNVNVRLQKIEKAKNTILPEVQWKKDGYVLVKLFIPEMEEIGEAAALEIGKKMNLKNVEVIHKQVLQKSEGTLFEIKGRFTKTILQNKLIIPKKENPINENILREIFNRNSISVVAATIGEDEHSVGLHEIIDIKHGGIEKYGIKTIYLGTSCPLDKLIESALETNSKAILVSVIITHNDIHIRNMNRLNELCIEMGVRNNLLLIAGGTQITDQLAKNCGLDAGFGRKTKGNEVASVIAKKLNLTAYPQ